LATFQKILGDVFQIFWSLMVHYGLDKLPKVGHRPFFLMSCKFDHMGSFIGK
jgi:hypothetical protein